MYIRGRPGGSSGTTNKNSRLRQSVFALWSFCNSRFELLLLATEPVSNTEGLLQTLVKYTSIIYISNIPLFTLPSFLIRQILGAVLLLVTSPFAVEALSLRLRSRLGLLHLSSNLLAVLFEVPLLPFALFLKLVVSSTINTWCFSWFLHSSISASRRARELLSSSLAYYSSSRSSTNLVMVTREFCQSLFYLED